MLDHLFLVLWLEKADFSWGCFLSVTVDVSRFSSIQAEVFMRQEKTQRIYCQVVPQVPRSLAIPLYFILPLESSISVLHFFPKIFVVVVAVISGRNKMECVYTILSGTSSLQSSTLWFFSSYLIPFKKFF